MAEKHTGLEVIPKENFEFLKIKREEVEELYRANIGVEGLKTFDLDRIRVAAGGNTMWVIPGTDGDVLVPEILGVIVGVKPSRAYWKLGLGEGGAGGPPDCSSTDGEIGVGIRWEGDTNEPHDCFTCKLSQWGSKVRLGKPVKGQACTARAFVFIIREDELVPSVLSLPPTSLDVLKKYKLNQLMKHNLRPWDVVTRWKLVKDVSADGVPYAKAQPSVGAMLSPEAKQALSERLSVLRDVIEKTKTVVEPEEEEV